MVIVSRCHRLNKSTLAHVRDNTDNEFNNNKQQKLVCSIGMHVYVDSNLGYSLVKPVVFFYTKYILLSIMTRILYAEQATMIPNILIFIACIYAIIIYLIEKYR